MGLFKVNKEQSHLAVGTDVSHRQKHAVAVIAGKGEGVFIHHPHEALVAAFVGDGRSALVINGAEKKQIP